MGAKGLGFIPHTVGALGRFSAVELYYHFLKDPSGSLGREWIQGIKMGQD